MISNQHLLMFIFIVCSISFLLSLFFFSPRFNYWNLEIEGAFEVDRANLLLEQLHDPFSSPGDPVLQWRRLIPFIGYYLHLSDNFFLALPFVGCLFLLAYVCLTLRNRTNGEFALYGTILFSTFSAYLVSFHWLGIFDSWYILLLLLISFSRNSLLLFLSACLGPFIDERFFFGLPVAFVVRGICKDEFSLTLNEIMIIAMGLLPYSILRIVMTVLEQSDPTYIIAAVRSSHWWLPFAPLGWWMSYKLAWILLIPLYLRTQRDLSAIKSFMLVFVLPFCLLLLVAILAADMSRSAAICAPMIVAGMLALDQIKPQESLNYMRLLLLANLLIPAAHVTYTKVSIISPLPVELLRLLN